MPHKLEKLIRFIKEVWYSLAFLFKYPETHNRIKKISSGGAYNVGNGKYLELFKLLELFKPKSILELGSGGSTAVFAEYARKQNAKLVCVDQSEKWLSNTKQALAGLPVEYELLPAKQEKTEPPKGYYVGLKNKYFDFVYIDGPSFGFKVWEKGLNRRTLSWNIIDLVKANPPSIIVFDGRYATVAYFASSFRNLYECFTPPPSLSLLPTTFVHDLWPLGFCEKRQKYRA